MNTARVEPIIRCRSTPETTGSSAVNGLGAQLEVEGRLQAEAMATADHKEGVAAFLQKRPAQFKGE